ncbi:MAG: GTPase, partial [Oribacterium sp.]
MERFLRKPPKKRKKDGRIQTEGGELLSSYQRKLRERLSSEAESEESAESAHGQDRSDGEGGRGERGR